ncbi:ABC transporter ATP-binding protein [Verminephrobacter aporrectodeae subsp. tuberculatae]|uniref:ABC transporter ATP-binding protein n=1 Tax=Verminephrobacter aporrectodeae TaxID=1110389 RepID=UPI00224492D6|nr:ABC transporter ATP-binding protein [Verminephrobacter aporrectodeae]MCW8198779.1 ABC transporter ATP-binding protein [Verminephrobacter aporrectodeae subsp. tuberculatae]
MRLIPAPRPASGALRLETCGLTKRFGSATALSQVSIRVAPGSVHALLGENGAGKSTLVRCVAGMARAEAGSILIDGREQDIANPAIARALGIGMVYQHFTLAPGMSVAENLLLAAGRLPWLLDWRARYAELRGFLARTPFSLDLDAFPADLAAGEKQKLELLKQLYLQPRLLILDEPTSVLTPQEADQVLGHIREHARRGACTVIIITHKFREVMAYADTVTVLRKGQAVHHGRVADSSPELLAQAMVGGAVAAMAEAEADAEAEAEKKPPAAARERPRSDIPALQVDKLSALGERGTLALHGLSLTLMPGEILGIAGVSGNGQRELLQALVGQRPRLSGTVHVMGQPYAATRAQNRRLKVRSLPEEPLHNACVAAFSVAQNMALRDFDQPPLATAGWGGWLRSAAWRERARAWIAEYGIKTRDETAAIQSLSGGNVQRAVLARELAGEIHVLIAANPAFGLDFAAGRDVHRRLRQVRERNAGVLLISEDLDELLALADRILVMSEGRIVFETTAAAADRQVLGAHMGGGVQGQARRHAA